MHYHAEIWVPEPPIHLHETVEKIMEPFRENYDEGTEERTGFWDFWQIGARYKGAHLPVYEQEKDSENHEKCDHPYTAIRGLPATECGYCQGSNVRASWPTKWVPHWRDVCSVAEAPDDLQAYTLIVDGKPYHYQEWDGDKFNKTEFDGRVKPMLEKLGKVGGYLITVDYHS